MVKNVAHGTIYKIESQIVQNASARALNLRLVFVSMAKSAILPMMVTFFAYMM
jgi:hypothetical protein